MAKTHSGLSPAETITNAIIARLEAGVRPWVQPWRPGMGGRPLRATGEPYRGINCFWLWMVAENRGYSSRTWMTYKQADALGAQVRKGERSEIAIFYKSYTKTVIGAVTGQSEDERRSVLRSYAVFNADQIDGTGARILSCAAQHRAARGYAAALGANLRRDVARQGPPSW